MTPATRDGPDTWLARLLLGSRRLELPVLQACLAESRQSGRRLADILVARGLIPDRELAAILASHAPREPGTPSSGPTWGEALEPGEVVGDDYRVLGLLGQGGMGAVYRVLETRTGRELALKVLLSDLDGEADTERFRREAEAAARVGQRPGFVQIHSSGTHRGSPYYVMEIVEGAELESQIDALSPAELARVLATVARSLSAFHESGFVHRDLKPANVLLGDDGQPRIVDLGLVSGATQAGLTATGEVLGTPAYMAPEQVVDARSVDPRSDVYALGAILYRGLCGRPPFSGSLISVLAAVVSDAPPRPSSLQEGVPPALEAVCLRALAKVPSERYPSAAELALDLERFCQGTLEAPPPSQAPLWIGLGLLALGGLVALSASDATWRSGGEGPSPSASASLGPDPAADRAEAIEELRALVRERRFATAKRRSQSLSSLPMDLRWAIKLHDLSIELDRVERRRREALAAFKQRRVKAFRKSDLEVRAIQAGYAPCHACLEGLEGNYEPEARSKQATDLVAELRGLGLSAGNTKGLSPEQAERGANLAGLIRVLDPQRSYAPTELADLVPSFPFVHGGDYGPSLRFATALADLDPNSPALHARLASWASREHDGRVQRALLPLVERALELGGGDRLELRVLRLGCLLHGRGDLDLLLREAELILGEAGLSEFRRARVLSLRGRARLYREEFAAAVLDLDASLALDPDPFVRSARARARRGAGDSAGALSDARQILSVQRPDSVTTHTFMVSILWDLDREGADVHDYVARLVDHQPGQPGWRLRLALLEFSSEARARVHVQAALSTLGRYSAEDRELAAAVRVMKPRVQGIHDLLGVDSAKAKQALSKVVAELDALRGDDAWP